MGGSLARASEARDRLGEGDVTFDCRHPNFEGCFPRQPSFFVAAANLP